jgi:hypothetical protein
VSMRESFFVSMREPIAIFVSIRESLFVSMREPIFVSTRVPVFVSIREPISVSMRESVCVSMHEHVFMLMRDPVFVSMRETVFVLMREPVNVSPSIGEPVLMPMRDGSVSAPMRGSDFVSMRGTIPHTLKKFLFQFIMPNHEVKRLFLRVEPEAGVIKYLVTWHCHDYMCICQLITDQRIAAAISMRRFIHKSAMAKYEFRNDADVLPNIDHHVPRGTSPRDDLSFPHRHIAAKLMCVRLWSWTLVSRRTQLISNIDQQVSQHS